MHWDKEYKIDVKFASGIKNINFGCTHTLMCLALYTQCFFSLPQKIVAVKQFLEPQLQ